MQEHINWNHYYLTNQHWKKSIMIKLKNILYEILSKLGINKFLKRGLDDFIRFYSSAKP